MKLCDSDLKKLVIGSDDEYAMVQAITTAFLDSTHTLCVHHLGQNANHWIGLRLRSSCKGMNSTDSNLERID